MEAGDTPFIEPSRNVRTEEPLRLICWGSDDQLALGLATAREVFAARGVEPGYAALCAMAVSMYESDPSLPQPSVEERAAGAVLSEATDAAILAAGARLMEDNELYVSQSPADRRFWNTQPTLRAWRVKTNSPLLDKD